MTEESEFGSRQGQEIFVLHSIQNGSGVYSNLASNKYHGLYHRGKVTAA